MVLALLYLAHSRGRTGHKDSCYTILTRWCLHLRVCALAVSFRVSHVCVSADEASDHRLVLGVDLVVVPEELPGQVHDVRPLPRHGTTGEAKHRQPWFGESWHRMSLGHQCCLPTPGTPPHTRFMTMNSSALGSMAYVCRSLKCSTKWACISCWMPSCMSCTSGK